MHPRNIRNERIDLLADQLGLRQESSPRIEADETSEADAGDTAKQSHGPAKPCRFCKPSNRPNRSTRDE